MYVSEQYTFGAGAVGQTALSIAVAKTSLGFTQAIALGMLCNALVCLAVWLSYGAHTTTDKILAIIPPIAAFVAAGFEHSVANMYFISIGLLIKSDDASRRLPRRLAFSRRAFRRPGRRGDVLWHRVDTRFRPRTSTVEAWFESRSLQWSRLRLSPSSA
jgi:hypothetical protein